MTDAYIAVDFGGGSGRVIAGYTSEGRLELDTIYRFQNRQVRMGGQIGRASCRERVFGYV